MLAGRKQKATTVRMGSGCGCCQTFAQRKNPKAQRHHHPERPDLVDEFVHAANRAVIEDVKTGHQHRIIPVGIGEIWLVHPVQKIFALFQIENLRLENPESVGVKFQRSFQSGEPAENPPGINHRQQQQQPQMARAEIFICFSPPPPSAASKTTSTRPRSAPARPARRPD